MNFRVPFLDLSISDNYKRKDLLAAIEKVMLHGKIILGPEVEELENIMSKLCNRKYGIGLGSGSDSLFLSLLALGIGQGDEVITTPMTFVATANAIVLSGAKPVFADVTSDLTIDPDSVEKLISKNTKAIIPVHFSSNMADMNKIVKIANNYNLKVIEDAAQAFGSSFYEQPAGAFGDLSCLSMNSMKVLASLGEAGMVLTDDIDKKNLLMSLRYNGLHNKINCINASINGRIETIQAAIILEKLKYYRESIEKRRSIAKIYNQYLSNYVQIPLEKKGQYSNYYTYSIITKKRDDLFEFLRENGIETKKLHPLVTDMSAYRIYNDTHLIKAKKFQKMIINLPCNNTISYEQVEYVIKIIRNFFDR